jgi:hypothetical protein
VGHHPRGIADVRLLNRVVTVAELYQLLADLTATCGIDLTRPAPSSAWPWPGIVIRRPDAIGPAIHR